MKLIACHNYVLIEVRDDPEERLTERGLLLPQNATPDVCTGEIISVGPDARIGELDVGSEVLFPPYGIGVSFRLIDTRYFAMLDHQLLGVFSGR